jgi:hypothetical protein
LEAGTCRDHRRSAFVDRRDDLAAVDALQVNAGNPKVGVLDMRVIWRPAEDPVDRVEDGLARWAVDTRWARSGGRPEGGWRCAWHGR